MTSVYIRTPAKLFRPARFDYMTMSRLLLAPDLAGKPYNILTHSSPALLYESVRRHGWQFIPNQVLPPMVANAAVGVILYSTYLIAMQYFSENRGWKWTIGGAVGKGADSWYSWVFSLYDSFRAGFIAGGVSSIAASPIDALYSRSNYAELVDSDVRNQGLYKYAWKKLKSIGVVGIFAGFWLNLMKESLGFGTYFALFEVIKSKGYKSTTKVLDWWDRVRGRENTGSHDASQRNGGRALQLTFVLFAGATAASGLIAVQYPFSKVQKVHLARLEALDIFNETNKVERSKWFKLYYNSYKQTWDILVARKLKSRLTWPAFMYKGFTRYTLTNIPATSVGLLVFEITRQNLSLDIRESLEP